MATSSKSIAASVVGWLIVAVIAYWFLGAVIGTIAFIIRFFVWIVVIGLLAALYLKLKAPDT